MDKIGKYKLDPERERKLLRMNEILKKFEEEMDFRDRTYLAQSPTFIVGAPRTGTTLMYQILAKTGLFNYVSNFTAEFWEVPKVGFLIDNFLGMTDYKDIEFKSDFGRTEGLSNVHHFSRFWTRMLGYNKEFNRFSLTDKKGEELNRILCNIEGIDRLSGIIKEQRGMESFTDRPLLFKSHYCGPVLDFISEHLGRINVIIMVRNITDTAMSILNARRKVLGSESKWWSLKTTNYENLNLPGLSPERQVLYQIAAIEKEIYGAWQSGNMNSIIIPYEGLCTNFYSTMNSIFFNFYNWYVTRRDSKFSLEDYVSENIKNVEIPSGKYRNDERWKKINDMCLDMWDKGVFSRKFHRNKWDVG